MSLSSIKVTRNDTINGVRPYVFKRVSDTEHLAPRVIVTFNFHEEKTHLPFQIFPPERISTVIRQTVCVYDLNCVPLRVTHVRTRLKATLHRSHDRERERKRKRVRNHPVNLRRKDFLTWPMIIHRLRC